MRTTAVPSKEPCSFFFRQRRPIPSGRSTNREMIVVRAQHHKIDISDGAVDGPCSHPRPRPSRFIANASLRAPTPRESHLPRLRTTPSHFLAAQRAQQGRLPKSCRCPQLPHEVPVPKPADRGMPSSNCLSGLTSLCYHGGRYSPLRSASIRRLFFGSHFGVVVGSLSTMESVCSQRSDCHQS